MLEKDEYLNIINLIPITSIDVLMVNNLGDILLGLRRNNPAKGMWFVPGGVIKKGETIDNAFHRIIKKETGISTDIKDAIFIGVYQHFYDTNFADVPDIKTQYTVLRYDIKFNKEINPIPDYQHSEFKWFSIDELIKDSNVHQYVKDYFL